FRSLSSISPFAVNKRTGTSISRKCLVSVKPSILGIITSTTARSGKSSTVSSRASSPFAALMTSYPAFVKWIVTKSSSFGSSSTANIVNILDFLSFRIDSLVTLCFIVCNECGILILISEVATLAGVSVGMLHYYDILILLTPDITPDAGYSGFSERLHSVVQYILFFRVVVFPLKIIKHLLQLEEFERLEALK